MRTLADCMDRTRISSAYMRGHNAYFYQNNNGASTQTNSNQLHQN